MNTRQVVWKFSITPTFGEVTTLRLPDGNPKVLDVGMQGREWFVWALVDPDQQDTVEREVLLLMTGQIVPEAWPLRYIRTIHHSSNIVVHIFEVL